jgi:hypothetical protein
VVASSLESSPRWPSPVWSRAWSAARIAYAVVSPVMPSEKAGPTMRGRSFESIWLSIPESAWPTVS